MSDTATEEPQRVYVLHHNDSDGRFAAYCAWKYFNRHAVNFIDRVKFLEVQYGQPFPIELDELTKDDRVFILDFSYDRATLDAVAERVGFLKVLDHHTSAEEQLRDAPYAHYDNTRSGALLAWYYFFPNAAVPLVCMYVNDYDLWQHLYPESRPLEAWIQFSRLGQNWKRWEELCNNPTLLKEALVEGRVLVAQNKSIINSFVKNPGNVAFRDHLYGEGARKVKIAVYNGNSILRNELAEAIYRRFGVDMTVQYRLREDRVTFSLRAPNPEKYSALEFASSYGGGGHAEAAGISLPLLPGLELIKALLAKPKSE